MANFVYNDKDIGSAGGRDFALLASFLSGLPNPFVNEMWRGRLFADGDFDEKNLGINAPNSPSDNANLIVHGAAGEQPVFKPAVGTASYIFSVAVSSMLAGVIADGVNLTVASRLFLYNGRGDITGCTARNGPLHGFDGFTQDIMWVYCLADNCPNGHGFTNPDGNSLALGCGAALCDNGFVGRSGTNFLRLVGCWALNNITADLGSFIIAQRFVYISDASIGAADDVFLNQVPANLGFVNFAARDYRLAAGSALLGMGDPLSNKERGIFVAPPREYNQWAVRDAFGNPVRLDYGQRMNIGPCQPSGTSIVNTLPVALAVADPRITLDVN